MIRKAIYSGTWYPDTKEEIARYMRDDLPRNKAAAAICPHAGWKYSGMIAGEVFSSIETASLYILIGPNHRGIGEQVSVFPEGAWQTPLGNLTVDQETSAAIVKHSSATKADAKAHLLEHSLEVQMPFIKFLAPDAMIVPIIMFDYRPQTCRDLAGAIVKALDARRRTDSVIIASTDMSHYISAAAAKKTDKFAIDDMLKLDAESLLRTVEEKEITMCGSGPAASAIIAAKERGAKKTRLIRYATSGETTGDTAEVVGYAGIVIYFK